MKRETGPNKERNKDELVGAFEGSGAPFERGAQMARDWRVRDAGAGAGTVVNCAVHTQQKIVDGKDEVQRRPEAERPKHD